MKRTLMGIVIIAVTTVVTHGMTAHDKGPVRVKPSGQSTSTLLVNGKTLRAVVTTTTIDVGRATQNVPQPQFKKTNCTYSRFPCSQVQNLSIWVNGQILFVNRSVFADLSDLGTMELTSVAGNHVLTITGGDGAETYFVKIFFDDVRIMKREVYAMEANSLVETTTYLPRAILD